MFIKVNNTLLNTDHIIYVQAIIDEPSFGKSSHAIFFQLTDGSIKEEFEYDNTDARDARLLQLRKILTPTTYGSKNLMP